MIRTISEQHRTALKNALRFIMCSSNKKINYLATRFVPYRFSIVNKINMIWLARVWPDFPASDVKFILASGKLGLFGFVFLEPEGGFIFIILYNIYVCAHFGPFGNWV